MEVLDVEVGRIKVFAIVVELVRSKARGDGRQERCKKDWAQANQNRIMVRMKYLSLLNKKSRMLLKPQLMCNIREDWALQNFYYETLSNIRAFKNLIDTITNTDVVSYIHEHKCFPYIHSSLLFLICKFKKFLDSLRLNL